VDRFMMAAKRLLCAIAFLAAAVLPALAVRELSFEQLLSVVFFESEDGYKYPAPFLCRHVALTAPDDTCNVSFRIIEPKICKVEIVREYRATWKNGNGAGREVMRSVDVVTLAYINLPKVGPPVFDPQRNTARMTLVGDLDFDRHEGLEYSVLFDDRGAYKSCKVGGVERDVSEEACAKLGKKPVENRKTMPLVFSRVNYNRSIAAVRWLQESYCPLPGEKT
jgi:hypothetical protein